MKRLLFVALSAAIAFTVRAGPLPELVMHKDPNCGCCGAWAKHLEAQGFRVKTVETVDMPSVKRRLAVPQRLTSCHTATVGGYVIEGHVPATAIKRLLRDKPPLTGLSVPGMPLGSPGMEVPGKQEAYDVISFDKTGQFAVFESYRRSSPVRREETSLLPLHFANAATRACNEMAKLRILNSSFG